MSDKNVVCSQTKASEAMMVFVLLSEDLLS